VNTYLPSGRPTFLQHEPMKAVRTHRYLAASHLAARERQRRYQAEAEVNRLVKQGGVMPKPGASRVSTLRQAIGEALVRVGQRLAGPPWSSASPETTAARGTLGRPV
jgi:hypothetical protein